MDRRDINEVLGAAPAPGRLRRRLILAALVGLAGFGAWTWLSPAPDADGAGFLA